MKNMKLLVTILQKQLFFEENLFQVNKNLSAIILCFWH